MRQPSRVIKSHMRKAVGESDYARGIKRNLQLNASVQEGMDSMFGAALYEALESIVKASLYEMETTSPLNVWKQIALRSELRVARYIKNVLDSYVVNKEALARNMEELQSQGDDEWSD